MSDADNRVNAYGVSAAAIKLLSVGIRAEEAKVKADLAREMTRGDRKVIRVGGPDGVKVATVSYTDPKDPTPVATVTDEEALLNYVAKHDSTAIETVASVKAWKVRELMEHALRTGEAVPGITVDVPPAGKPVVSVRLVDDDDARQALIAAVITEARAVVVGRDAAQLEPADVEPTQEPPVVIEAQLPADDWAPGTGSLF